MSLFFSFAGSARIYSRLSCQSRTVSMYLGKKVAEPTQNVRVVDMRSDTLSKPSPLMRKAMFEAVVGDDVYGEDPTVKALEEKAASMLGKESALFVPSGTMSNLIGVMTHCKQRGSEMITGDLCHIHLFEQGGSAYLGGIHTTTVPTNPDGTFDINLVEKKIRPNDCHYPTTSLICVENTHNVCGGKVLPLAWLDKLGETARRLGVPLHMDGARLFNAAVYLKVPPTRIVRHFDSISICLSKSLGAPVGSVLVGSTEFIQSARRLRKALGGGMRQAGMIAAAGLYSLNNLIDRLAEDHARAATIAKAIADMKSPFIKVDLENLHTNILMINVDPNIMNATEFVNRLATVSEDENKKLKSDACVVKIGPRSEDCCRMVIYCDITDEDVAAVINKFKFVNSEYS